jgi:hypothetical protein
LTRVEEYVISNKQVFVVRDDLHCQFPGCNNVKARGLFEHLKNIDNEIIGVVDTCVSRAGWCTAWAGSQLNKKVYVYVSQYCADDFFRLMAKLHGANIVTLRANLSSVMYNMAKKHIGRLGGYLLPKYLRLRESIEEMVKVASEVLSKYGPKTVVVLVSSGVMASGILKAAGRDVDVINVTHVTNNFDERLRFMRNMTGRQDIILKPMPGYKYGQENYNVRPPFPCDIYYDRWAWQWLVENINSLKEPIAFWNIGGEWHHETGMYPFFRGDGVNNRSEVDRWIESRRALLQVPA